MCASMYSSLQRESSPVNRSFCIFICFWSALRLWHVLFIIQPVSKVAQYVPHAGASNTAISLDTAHREKTVVGIRIDWSQRVTDYTADASERAQAGNWIPLYIVCTTL